MNYKEYKQKQKEELEAYKQKLKAELDEFKEKLKIKLEKFKLKTKAKAKNTKKKPNKRKRKGGVVSENFLETFLDTVIAYLKNYFCDSESELNFVQILEKISDEELKYLKDIPISESSYTDNTLFDNFDDLFKIKFEISFANKINYYYDIRKKLLESITRYTYIPQEIPKENPVDNTHILISIICKLYYEMYKLELQGISLSNDEIFNKIYNKLNEDEIKEIRNLDSSNNSLLELLLEGVFSSIESKNKLVNKETYLAKIKSFINDYLIKNKDKFSLDEYHSSNLLMNVNSLLNLLDLLKDNQESQFSQGRFITHDPLLMIPYKAPSLKNAREISIQAILDRAKIDDPLGNP